MFSDFIHKRFPTELLWQTDSAIPSCHNTKDNILRIINKLDSNKGDCHDKTDISMLKIYVS